MSPVLPLLKANKTKSTASSKDIINLVIVGSVMVISFPFFICSIHSGITEPLEHITLPYLVQHILVFFSSTVLDFATITFSIIAFDVPIAFTGYAALSVERQTTFLTPSFIAQARTFSVPKTFVLTASIGKNSQEGTCFKAAA